MAKMKYIFLMIFIFVELVIGITIFKNGYLPVYLMAYDDILITVWIFINILILFSMR